MPLIDKESNYLVDSLLDRHGRIVFLNKKDKQLEKLNANSRRSTKFAIIVLNEDMKNEAKKHFGNPLLFSIHEAKGLEYENIILFNIVSSESKKYEEIASGVYQEDLKSDLSYSRAKDKKDKSMEVYKFYINAFYVAITRAIENLYIIEERSSHDFLKLLNLEQYSSELEVVKEESESSIESWQKEASELEKQGKIEQAENIRKEILREKKVPWDVMTNTKYKELQKKVFEDTANKQEKILLFEYCLIYDKKNEMSRLRNMNLKAALHPKRSFMVIKEKYFSSYIRKNYQSVIENTKIYGLNFRNPFNQTPLIAASKLCNPLLIKQLVEQGSDISIRDNNGHNCLQNLLSSILIGTAGEIINDESDIFDSYTLLSSESTSIKIDDRLVKLDPRTMEFFLYNAMIGLFGNPFSILINIERIFESNTLVRVLSKFPDNILKTNRKKRIYISSILSKNEKNKIGQYNRRLFLRITRGRYVLNPDIEVKENGEWVKILDILKIKHVPKT